MPLLQERVQPESGQRPAAGSAGRAKTTQAEAGGGAAGLREDVHRPHDDGRVEPGPGLGTA